MSQIDRKEVTQILVDLRHGSVDATERLLAVVYGELRRLAEAKMRSERADHTLQPTALVNEAYMRLINQERVDWQGRGHFFGTAAQIMRRALLASGGGAALSAALARLQPLSLIALLATLVLLFGFQGEQILRQPTIIALLAIPILIQVYFNAGFAYLLNRLSGEQHCVAGPSALIGASNFFELAVAAAISLFGFESGAALATVVGVLIEVPVMLTVVWIVNGSKDWYERKTPSVAGANGTDRHA